MKYMISSSRRAFSWVLMLVFIIIAASINSSLAICEEKVPRAKGIRTLYLIRHGEYNHEDKRDSYKGKGLVPLGIAQAKLVAARLRALPVKMTSLTSSTMTRARQTAMVINKDFPYLILHQSPLISECVPPTWRKDVMAEKNPEGMADCKIRLDKAFSKFFRPSPDKDRNDIIVCHGNVIRYFVTRVLGVEYKSWLRMAIYNCSLTVVRIYPDGAMKLVSFNDIGHIPPNLQTETSADNSARLLRVNGR